MLCVLCETSALFAGNTLRHLLENTFPEKFLPFPEKPLAFPEKISPKMLLALS